MFAFASHLSYKLSRMTQGRRLIFEAILEHTRVSEIPDTSRMCIV